MPGATPENTAVARSDSLVADPLKRALHRDVLGEDLRLQALEPKLVKGIAGTQQHRFSREPFAARRGVEDDVRHCPRLIQSMSRIVVSPTTASPSTIRHRTVVLLAAAPS